MVGEPKPFCDDQKVKIDKFLAVLLLCGKGGQNWFWDSGLHLHPSKYKKDWSLLLPCNDVFGRWSFLNSALPLWHFFRVCLHLKNNNTLGRANSYKKDYNLHFSFFSQEIKMRLYIWSWNILPLIFFMDNNFKRVGVVLVASYFTTTTPWRICPTCFWPLIQDVN